MLTPELLSLDIAALRTLVLVDRLGSFSAAAEELGVKQSSVSYTIERIRRALNDPLFLRQGGGLAVTDRCGAAVGFAKRLLAEAEQLTTDTAFDPSQASGTIVITTGFYVQSVVMPGVIKRIRQQAKGLSVRFIAPSNVDTALFERKSDLVILPFEFEANGVYCRTLFSDHDIVLMDPANPIVTKGLDIDTYGNADHISFELGSISRFQQRWSRELTEMGYKPNIVVSTYDGFMVPFYVMGTDLIATMSARAARNAAPNLAMVPSPLDIGVTVHMYWTATADRSPLNQWLRQLVIDSVVELGLSD